MKINPCILLALTVLFSGCASSPGKSESEDYLSIIASNPSLQKQLKHYGFQSRHLTFTNGQEDRRNELHKEIDNWRAGLTPQQNFVVVKNTDVGWELVAITSSDPVNTISKEHHILVLNQN